MNDNDVDALLEDIARNLAAHDMFFYEPKKEGRYNALGRVARKLLSTLALIILEQRREITALRELKAEDTELRKRRIIERANELSEWTDWINENSNATLFRFNKSAGDMRAEIITIVEEEL